MTSSYGTWADVIIKHLKTRTSYIFLGGIHPTVRYREIFETYSDTISGIVIGEGEKVFFEIAKEILLNGKDLERIEHLCTLKKIESDPEVNIPPCRLDNLTLTHLPNPEYRLQYKRSDEIIARLYSTRGCINNCSICSVANFFHADREEDPSLVHVDKLIEKIGNLY